MNHSQYWQLSNRGDPPAVKLADRHYSRQKPGTPQFMPPGRALVLITPERNAVLGFSWPYPQYCFRPHLRDAWNCTIFRNESSHLASDMIRDAIGVAVYIWGSPSPDGVVTYVDASQIKSVNPGYCFKKAGFNKVGMSSKGLHWLHPAVADMPEPIVPLGYQLSLFV